MDTLRDQQKVEKVLPLQSDNPYEKWKGKIKVELRWVFSAVKLIQDLIDEHQREKTRTQDTIREYEDKIIKLQQPFWWMDKTQIRELEAGDVESHEYRNDSVKRIAGTVSNSERALSTKFNPIARSLPGWNERKESPWFLLMKILLAIYTFLTLLICLIRHDFINLSI